MFYLKKLEKKISVSLTGIKLYLETRAKLSIIGAERQVIKVKVINIVSKDIKEYPTITKAASALAVSRTAIKKAMELNKLIKKIFIIKKLI